MRVTLSQHVPNQYGQQHFADVQAVTIVAADGSIHHFTTGTSSRPVYLTPERVVALENVWHEAMGTPGDDHDRAEIEDYNEVAAIIAEAKGEL